MLHLHPALAERERKVIGERTGGRSRGRQGRGQVLGNPRLAEARRICRDRLMADADSFADSVAPAIRAARAAGAKSLQQMRRRSVRADKSRERPR
jgi:hypothetical protein